MLGNNIKRFKLSASSRVVVTSIAAVAAVFWTGTALSTDPADVVEERIRPVGTVVVAKTQSEAPEIIVAARSGEEVVAMACVACHGTGVAGAPKIGDKAAWESRYAAGLEAMVTVAIDGRGAMPARGGNATLTDEEVRNAVVKMLQDSGFDVAAASAPAPAESAQEAPAAAEAAPAVGGGDLARGVDVYTKACVACHGIGVAGAPKVGDVAAWQARIAQGMEVLVGRAIDGYMGKSGVMPAKGGNPSLSDADVSAAVDYMVSEVQ